MDYPITRLIRSKLEEALRINDEHITGGGPQDFQSYREAVGCRTGILVALEALEETEKEFDASLRPQTLSTGEN